MTTWALEQHQWSLKTVFYTEYRPLLSEEGLGAAVGYSPELWQVLEGLVRSGTRLLKNKQIV